MKQQNSNKIFAPKLKPRASVMHNLSSPVAAEAALNLNEAHLSKSGAIICDSGRFKGRSPKDKFIVVSKENEKHIYWGDVNQKMDIKTFDQLYDNVTEFLNKKDLFVYDGFAAASKKHEMGVRIVTTKAWHNLFVRNMFINKPEATHENFVPGFTILCASDYHERQWEKLGLNSDVFIALDLERRIAIIGGTEYAGEMKKGIFSVLNYYLPRKGVLAMHCSATVGEKGDVAIYFGLSGTGKTTLSADNSRFLIGDDEHGWSDDGVFNFEGGCYAKTYKLSRKNEPEIYDAIKFGSLVENVKYDLHTREIDFNDKSITENGRVSYPLDFIEKTQPNGEAGHPSFIFMLTCDAFGLLPPIARLTPEQASYYFLSGYTSKMAGTEKDVKEPAATFSYCFGKPFMTLSPGTYGDLLSQKISKHKAQAFLINTGWVGGKTGNRCELKYTREIIKQVLNGAAAKAKYVKDEVFGFEIPVELPGLPAKILDPKKYWKDEKEYLVEYKKLAKMFQENFSKTHKGKEDIAKFGPK